MRIIFMGTPEFSVPTLKALINSEHEVIAVYTQPDKPKGRGKSVAMTPVKEIALTHDIPVFQPRRVREEAIIEDIRNLKPDAIVVVAFGQILPQKLLEIPKYGCLNIHASLLPKYRGAAPIQWAVINGEEKTGVTTMLMDVGIDTGEMLLSKEVKIEPHETGGSLHDKLSILGGPIILETLVRIRQETLKPTPQRNEDSCSVPMLTKELGNIDWTKSAIEIERLIRGLNPWPSAYTFLQGKMMKIWEAQLVETEIQTMEPGTISEIDLKKGFTVSCGKGALLIKTLQLQGKNKMDTPAFLRGVSIEKGIVLKQE